MANKPANAAQKRWMSDIADFINEVGLGAFYGDEYIGRTDFQLHHVLGRSAKQNKVAIGHWFIIPVPFELHDISSNHALNVTHHKHSFTHAFGYQGDIFNKMATIMDDHGYITPDLEVCYAIKDTNA